MRTFRALRRLIFNLMTTLSLLICIGCVMVRFAPPFFIIHHPYPKPNVSLRSVDGTFRFTIQQETFMYHEFWRQPKFYHLGAIEWLTSDSRSRPNHVLDITAPLYYLFIAASLPPILWLIVRRKEFGSFLWRDPDRCPVCQADIRQTPLKCPQCGAIPTEIPISGRFDASKG